MGNENNYLKVVFDDSLKNYLELEKTLYEAYPMYLENPSEEMKFLITNVCNFARMQLSTLMDMLPNIYEGSMYNSYYSDLNNKSDELFDFQKNISNFHQK